VTDSLGLILACEVTPANVSDADAAAKMIPDLMSKYPTIKTVYVDNAYQRMSFLNQTDQFDLEVNTPTEVVAVHKTGFNVIAKRWVIERTNAWTVRCRNLFRDVDRLYDHSKAWIYLSMIRLMLRRLNVVKKIKKHSLIDLLFALQNACSVCSVKG
jgi:putative transposase